MSNLQSFRADAVSCGVDKGQFFNRIPDFKGIPLEMCLVNQIYRNPIKRFLFINTFIALNVKRDLDLYNNNPMIHWLGFTFI